MVTTLVRPHFKKGGISSRKYGHTNSHTSGNKTKINAIQNTKEEFTRSY